MQFDRDSNLRSSYERTYLASVDVKLKKIELNGLVESIDIPTRNTLCQRQDYRQYVYIYTYIRNFNATRNTEDTYTHTHNDLGRRIEGEKGKRRRGAVVGGLACKAEMTGES